MIAGAAIGAAAGGAAGKGVAAVVNPQEDAYWRGAYRNAAYYAADRSYEDYEPAYRLGYTGRTRYNTRLFDDAEPHLAREWDSIKGTSRLSWNEAKLASRAAWDRIVI